MPPRTTAYRWMRELERRHPTFRLSTPSSQRAARIAPRTGRPRCPGSLRGRRQAAQRLADTGRERACPFRQRPRPRSHPAPVGPFAGNAHALGIDAGLFLSQPAPHAACGHRRDRATPVVGVPAVPPSACTTGLQCGDGHDGSTHRDPGVSELASRPHRTRAGRSDCLRRQPSGQRSAPRRSSATGRGIGRLLRAHGARQPRWCFRRRARGVGLCLATRRGGARAPVSPRAPIRRAQRLTPA
ncbi:hypothetical protein SANTM175S_06597 [Streptomyces antimycoticus]